MTIKLLSRFYSRNSPKFLSEFILLVRLTLIYITLDYAHNIFYQPNFETSCKHNMCQFFSGPPEAPNKVKVDGGCDKFSAKLLWHIQSNNYEPIQYLIIQMAMSYGDAEWHNISERVAPNVDEKTIKNLSPWTQYRFRVLAINKIGTSAPSEPTQFKECRTPAAGKDFKINVTRNSKLWEYSSYLDKICASLFLIFKGSWQ